MGAAGSIGGFDGLVDDDWAAGIDLGSGDFTPQAPVNPFLDENVAVPATLPSEWKPWAVYRDGRESGTFADVRMVAVRFEKDDRGETVFGCEQDAPMYSCKEYGLAEINGALDRLASASTTPLWKCKYPFVEYGYTDEDKTGMCYHAPRQFSTARNRVPGYLSQLQNDRSDVFTNVASSTQCHALIQQESQRTGRSIPFRYDPTEQTCYYGEHCTAEKPCVST